MFLDHLAPEARERRISIGLRCSSEATLAQALSMTQHLGEWESMLADHAFSPVDGAFLNQCAGQLQAFGIERDTVATGKASASEQWVAAEREAKRLRRQGRSLLVACNDAASESPTDATPAIKKKIDGAMKATADFDVDAPTLSRQIAALSTAIAKQGIAEVAKTRGGPRVAERLASSRSRLDAAESNRPRKPGTPV